MLMYTSIYLPKQFANKEETFRWWLCSPKHLILRKEYIYQCDSNLLYCLSVLAVPVAVVSTTSQQRTGLECKWEHTRVRTHTRNGQEVRKWTVTTKKVPMHVHRAEMTSPQVYTHVQQSKSTLYNIHAHLLTKWGTDNCRVISSNIRV
jgi:hypothetical protein